MPVVEGAGGGGSNLSCRDLRRDGRTCPCCCWNERPEIVEAEPEEPGVRGETGSSLELPVLVDDDELATALEPGP